MRLPTRFCRTTFLAVIAISATLPVARAQDCAGDCDGDRRVNVEELVLGVRIALGTRPTGDCRVLDRNGDEEVTVEELVGAVGAALEGCPVSSTTTPTFASTPTPTPDPQIPPVEEPALTAWLQTAVYRTWTSESTIHDSLGPHFGRVRTYLNDAIFASLSAGLAAHPTGAAIVKELYGRSGDQLGGWSVMVKLQDDSDGGDGWYWYENFGGIYAAEPGAVICTGCHSIDYRGLVNRDFVLTPFPLQ